jgi:hypothetical protein
MGTWGPGIFEDDVALDVRGDFQEHLDSGTAPEAAADQVLGGYQDSLEDMDDGPVVILALAASLLDAGVRSHSVLDEARRVIETQAGLERWEDDPTALAQRRAVYREMAGRLKAK